MQICNLQQILFREEPGSMGIMRGHGISRHYKFRLQKKAPWDLDSKISSPHEQTSLHTLPEALAESANHIPDTCNAFTSFYTLRHRGLHRNYLNQYDVDTGVESIN
ncbi:hypothetical protein C0J52_28418 [Blattella germanica]|nr:hypothetical protein C0J52_28418 [Blattella germanica]